jgi:hypothetical protein
MRGKIRQWFVDNPRAMDAAYVLMLGGSIFWEIGTQDASGATTGP